VKVLPGQWHAARGDVAITTVLGSCVSSCLWDPVERIGGIADRRRMVAKLFGGAQLLAKDLLDGYPRKVHFLVGTGKVQVQRLTPAPGDTVQRRERDYLARLSGRRGGDVEIFRAPR
jgi:chemotaxis protein CheD